MNKTNFQIRHKHWGVFQGEDSKNPRAPAGSWTVACPGVGLCGFDTRELAQSYIDLICRFFQGMVKPVPREDFSVESFDEELAKELGGVNKAWVRAEAILAEKGKEAM